MTIQSLQFKNTQFDITDISGTPWLRLPQIGAALGYASPYKVQQVYDRNADEFTDSMTQVIELQTAGGKQQVRIFSLRGAHLIGMLARTKKAQEFRRWVLDILERETQKQQPQRPALPTPANMEANREMFDIIASIENTLAKAYCGPSLNDQIRALTGKRRFDLDFYQLAALIRKLVEMMPQQIMEKHPEIRRLKNAEKYSFNRPAGLPPQPAKPAANPAETAHPDRDALYHGCRSHIGALLLHPSGKTKQDKEQIIQAALDEMDNILHVVVTAAENHDYNEENRNLGKSELTTAVYELTKLQRLINDCARSW